MALTTVCYNSISRGVQTRQSCVQFSLKSVYRRYCPANFSWYCLLHSFFFTSSQSYHRSSSLLLTLLLLSLFTHKYYNHNYVPGGAPVEVVAVNRVNNALAAAEAEDNASAVPPLLLPPSFPAKARSISFGLKCNNRANTGNI